MRILIATHHLLGYSGSELYTLWLAKSVKQAGHDVYVYSPYIDKLANDFLQADIPLTAHLEAFSHEKFDVAHVHHNIIAQEVRLQFPELPIVMQIHGSGPLLEQLPQENIFPSFLLCVCESVREHLIAKGIHPGFLEISRNGIELDWWQAPTLPSKHPRKALLLSAKIPPEKEQTIDSACKSLGITVQKIGGRFGQATKEQVRAAMHHCDFVITIGRGVLEAIAASRQAFVFDIAGGDGFVTPENFKQLMATNFNGKITASQYSAEQLTERIRNGYNPDQVQQNRVLLNEYFAADRVVDQLLRYYSLAADEVVPPVPFVTLERMKRLVALIRETRIYSHLDAQQQLEAFRAGKVYQAWRAWHKIVDRLHSH